MTLVLDRTAYAVGDALLHALVIGTATYPYVKGCGIPELQNLSDLPCAVDGAKIVLQWLEKQFHPPPGLQLGTIELLLDSPSASGRVSVTLDGKKTRVDPPTISAIEAACDDWTDRLKEDSRNVALFYYCGHGFYAGDTLLSAQDLASRANDPAGATINFGAFHEGMRRFDLDAQLFLLDTCSSPAGWIPNQRGGPLGRALVQLQRGDPMHPHARMRSEATAPGTAAHYPPSGAPYFSRVLRGALADDLGCTQDPSGKWVTSHTSLGNAINELLEHELKGRKLTGTQIPTHRVEGGAFVVHHPSKPPDVPVHTTTDPRQAIRRATLTISSPGGVHVAGPARVNDYVWSNRVAPARYDLSASFPPNSFTGTVRPIDVAPPMRPYTLKV